MRASSFFYFTSGLLRGRLAAPRVALAGPVLALGLGVLPTYGCFSLAVPEFRSYLGVTDQFWT